MKKLKREVLHFSGFLVICVFGISITACTLGPAAPKPTAENQKPNILIITVDNIGYGDLKPFNEHSPIITPNIDLLATQGARLTNFYTASPTCTVSRASLLSGRSPQRHQLVSQLSGIAGNYGIGLSQSEIIIPKMIKSSDSDYATGAFGKWNIGFAPGSRPTERGFDEYLGIASGNADHFTHVYAGKHDLYHNTESINRNGDYSTDLFANAAIDFIQEQTQNSTPWFVYLPFDAPHHPGDRNVAPGEPNIWKAPDYAFEPYGLSSDEQDPKKRFNAVVTAIDFAVGRVLNMLDSLGIADNTFVFLYSDNGAFQRLLNIQSNAPLRGAGVTLWEGGIRVPAIARWPGKIKENSFIDTRLWSPDLFVAAAELSGAELPQDRIIDGKNPMPVLMGETTTSPHASLFFQYENYGALLWGGYKILREGPDQPWKLFNLKNDISESNNLAYERPDLVKKMEEVFKLKKEEIESDINRSSEQENTNQN